MDFAIVVIWQSVLMFLFMAIGFLLFKTEKIKIKIPCLLAYGKSDVYENASELYSKVISEAEAIRDYYKKHTYIFEGFAPEIVFYVFP